MNGIRRSERSVGVTCIRIATAAVLFALCPMPTIAQETPPEQYDDCACKDVLSPTQAANLFWDELSKDSNFDNQASIVSKYLEFITFDDSQMASDRLDRLALGEGAFLTFQVQLAHDYFESALEGDDLIASHATDRMMQIKFRALEEYDVARKMVDNYYERFPPSERNVRGRYQQISNFAAKMIAEDQQEDAVRLILDELEVLPADAPYMSYALLSRFSETIRASTLNSEVTALVATRIVDLRSLAEEWDTMDVSPAHDPIIRQVMPEWYWRAQNIRTGETLREGRRRQLGGLIKSLEDWNTGGSS